MEGLAPPLKLIVEARRAIESGESLRVGINRYIQVQRDDFSSVVQRWLVGRDQGQKTSQIIFEIKSPYRRALLEILDRGLAGQSILPQLLGLETETEEATREEMDQYIAMLPFKMMVPLLLFQFPALMFLLFAPLTQEFLKSLGGVQ